MENKNYSFSTIDRRGFVYIVQSGTYFKIGRSSDVLRRLRQLQTGSAEDVVLILTLKFRNCATMEKQIHRRFKEKRLRGEWFDLKPKDIKWIVFKFQKYIRTYKNPVFKKYDIPENYKPFEIDNLSKKYFILEQKEKYRKKREKQIPKRFIVPFGKYKGRKLYCNLKNDPSYFKWILENFTDESKLKYPDFIKYVNLHFINENK